MCADLYSAKRSIAAQIERWCTVSDERAWPSTKAKGRLPSSMATRHTHCVVVKRLLAILRNRSMLLWLAAAQNARRKPSHAMLRVHHSIWCTTDRC